MAKNQEPHLVVGGLYMYDTSDMFARMKLPAGWVKVGPNDNHDDSCAFHICMHNSGGKCLGEKNGPNCMATLYTTTYEEQDEATGPIIPGGK